MRLYKFCHRDATNYCHAPQNWHSQRQSAEETAPALGYLVLACLYRSITHVTVPANEADAQQEMQQVRVSTCNLHLTLAFIASNYVLLQLYFYSIIITIIILCL